MMCAGKRVASGRRSYCLLRACCCSSCSDALDCNKWSCPPAASGRTSTPLLAPAMHMPSSRGILVLSATLTSTASTANQQQQVSSMQPFLLMPPTAAQAVSGAGADSLTAMIVGRSEDGVQGLPGLLASTSDAGTGAGGAPGAAAVVAAAASGMLSPSALATLTPVSPTHSTSSHDSLTHDQRRDHHCSRMNVAARRTANGQQLIVESPNEIRSLLQQHSRSSIVATASAQLQHTQTRQHTSPLFTTRTLFS